jgi:uncharacterized protein (TIGR02594 family)
MPTPVQFAQTMLGKREQPDRAALQDYLTTGGQNLDPATTAWCAAFVNSALAQSGQRTTGSNLARSFQNWGVPFSGDPQPGDIAIFSRGDPQSGQGHVGFYQGTDPKTGTINLLGGNQGRQGEVSIAGYNPGQLLGYRRARPANMPENVGGGPTVPQLPLPPDQQDKRQELATLMGKGKNKRGQL